jgi:hypothetical protein
MKRILYEKVEMRQEFRNYNFENLWQ